MTPLNSIVCCRSTVAKEKMSAIGCPGCGEVYRWRRHGFYWRYRPGGQDQIAVPRFRCQNTKCHRVTFSVLSHPVLRYKRHTLAFYTHLRRLLCWVSVGRLARRLGRSWTTIRRWQQDAIAICRFLAEEGQREPWGPCPCRVSERHWAAFTRDLYRALSPHPT